jgi:hypothetical protein
MHRPSRCALFVFARVQGDGAPAPGCSAHAVPERVVAERVVELALCLAALAAALDESCVRGDEPPVRDAWSTGGH